MVSYSKKQPQWKQSSAIKTTALVTWLPYLTNMSNKIAYIVNTQNVVRCITIKFSNPFDYSRILM